MKAEAKKVLRKVVEFGPNENGDFVLLSQFYEQCGIYGSKRKALKKFIDQSGYTSGKVLNSSGIDLANQVSIKNVLSKVINFVKSAFESVTLYLLK